MCSRESFTEEDCGYTQRRSPLPYAICTSRKKPLVVMTQSLCWKILRCVSVRFFLNDVFLDSTQRPLPIARYGVIGMRTGSNHHVKHLMNAW